MTGLDDYNARYYDPVVGQFVSADSVQGDMQGMDPYAYVGGNPETDVDPTGNRPICGDIGECNSGGSGGSSGAGQSAGETHSSGTGQSAGETHNDSSNQGNRVGHTSRSGLPETKPKPTPTTAPSHGGSKSVGQKLPTNSNDGIKNPGLFATGVGELLLGSIVLGGIIGLATQPGGALVEKLGWPIIAAMASYALRLTISGIRDMFEALDQVNKVAIVMLDMVELAVDIDIAVFTSADIVYHLATVGLLGQVVDANASLMGAIRAGIATEDGKAELMTMMGDTLGIVSAGSALNIEGDWQQLQADDR